MPRRWGVVPGADQQQRAPQQAGCDRMTLPRARLERIQPQPGQPHTGGIQALQQGWAIAQKGAAVEALADRPPSLLIASAATALGRQLQGPAQPQRPPVGAALAGPMQALIQPATGGGQAIGPWIVQAGGGGVPCQRRCGRAAGWGGPGGTIGRWGALCPWRPAPGIRVVQQLGEALIGEAIEAHLAVGPRQPPNPAHRLRPVLGLLSKARKLSLRATPSAHVLDHHQEAVGGIPGGMGVGDGGGDGAAVGLAHQQHRSWRFPRRPPEPCGQASAVGAGHPQVLRTSHSTGIGAIQPNDVGDHHLGVHRADFFAAGHVVDRGL